MAVAGRMLVQQSSWRWCVLRGSAGVVGRKSNDAGVCQSCKSNSCTVYTTALARGQFALMH